MIAFTGIPSRAGSPRIRAFAWPAAEIVALTRAGSVVLEHLLPDDERARVCRILPRRTRLMALAAHALKRVVLSRLRGGAPHDLAFSVGRYGKPALIADPSLCFSLSHCDEGVALAVSDGHEIGIDIESLRRHVDVDATLSFTAAPTESARVLAQPSMHQRKAELLRLWVLKEAVLKSLGIGLSVEPSMFPAWPADDGASMHRVEVPGGHVAHACELPVPDRPDCSHLCMALAIAGPTFEPIPRWQCMAVGPNDLWPQWPQGRGQSAPRPPPTTA
jgi:phosphopantetheinyl transferase